MSLGGIIIGFVAGFFAAVATGISLLQGVGETAREGIRESLPFLGYFLGG